MKRAIYFTSSVLFAAMISISLLSLNTAPAMAGAEEIVKFHSIVDLAFVKEYAVIPKREDVAIIDARPKARKYDKGHIPGALSIPDREFDQHVKALPVDKKTLMIYYCGGEKCSLSHKSAFKAEKLGYTNVKVFAAGYPAWIKGGNVGAVSTEYVKKLVDTGAKALIVDARPKARKYDKGHIPGAVSIPDREFDQHVAQLPADKTTPLIFYCGGYKCTLSGKSAQKAAALGYTNVKTYTAGFPAWKSAYGPDAVATGAASAALAIKAGTDEGTISIDSFQKIVEENPQSIMLVDVRDPAVYKQGSFKTAVNIPIDALEKKIDSLPKDKPIVFFCNSGGMAGEAYDMAKMLASDLKVYFLEAEVAFQKDGSYKISPVT
ncbi:MAG: rhodanese-like domain-containing protein [Pseudomonadota bacterium]|nr:MAG: rhodanese-like domain-containing protein [Pseudomonadota bacterium]